MTTIKMYHGVAKIEDGLEIPMVAIQFDNEDRVALITPDVLPFALPDVCVEKRGEMNYVGFEELANFAVTVSSEPFQVDEV